MTMTMRSMAVAAGLMVSQMMLAQAPAGAPAGATGICKDGTYSMAPSKSGACSGHKGVKEWYAAMAAKGAASAKPAGATAATPTSAKPMPAAAPVAKVPAAAMPAPAAKATPASTPAAASAPAAKAAPGSRAAMPMAAGGGPGLVWVNTESKVYHCSGTEFYGKTKKGAYMSEADAKAKGARGERGKTCEGK